MKRNPLPVYTNGERNIFCPHYRECLDHAAKRRWKSWACSECIHLTTEGPLDIIFTTGGQTPYYRVSPDIHTKF